MKFNYFEKKITTTTTTITTTTTNGAIESCEVVGWVVVPAECRQPVANCPRQELTRDILPLSLGPPGGEVEGKHLRDHVALGLALPIVAARLTEIELVRKADIVVEDAAGRQQAHMIHLPWEHEVALAPDGVGAALGRARTGPVSARCEAPRHGFRRIELVVSRVALALPATKSALTSSISVCSSVTCLQWHSPSP